MSTDLSFGYMPYRGLRTRILIPAGADANGFALWQEDGSLEPFTDYSNSYEGSQEVLRLLGSYLGEDNAVTRIELLYDGAQRRGMVLYDAYGKLVLHVLVARLGYPGTASGPVESILRHLGVSREMFVQMNTRVWGRSYALVVSRQVRTFVEGAEVAWCNGRYVSQWEWHEVDFWGYCSQ